MATSNQKFLKQGRRWNSSTPLPWTPPQATPCNSMNHHLQHLSRRHHSRTTSRSQPSNRGSILVKVQVILWSQLLLPSLSITVDTAFWKDYTLQGCTKLASAPPGPLLVHKSSSSEDGRAGTVMTFTLHEPHPRAIGEAEDLVQCLFQHPGPRPPPTHTVIVIIFSIVTHTQMENFKLKDPGRHPHKLVSRWRTP